MKRYYVNDITELTEGKIAKIILDWQSNQLQKLIDYSDYYMGSQEILNKYYSDPSKPCNKIVVNYCYDIVENYVGYLSGVPVTYSSDENIDDVVEILNYNDVHSEDIEYLRKALIYGVAYELNYLDSEAQQRFKLLESTECIPIYQNDIEEELLAVIRLYSANDLDNPLSGFVDVYTDKEIIHYKSENFYINLNLIEAIPHYYNMVPITVFSLNRDETSIFDRVIGLNDAYNKLLSASIDDYEAFVDAFLVLIGTQADSEDIKQMREDRVLLLDEAGQADFLVKNQNGGMTESLLDRIDRQIAKIAKCPDFNSAEFMSQSGIAIRYKLVGMENQASSIEANMKKALLKRLELMAQIQKLTADNLGWRDINIVFTRNLPSDITDTLNLVNTLRGLVSDRTLLSQIPFIDDVDEEIELLQEQKEQEKSSVYDFNYGDEEE